MKKRNTERCVWAPSTDVSVEMDTMSRKVAARMSRLEREQQDDDELTTASDLVLAALAYLVWPQDCCDSYLSTLLISRYLTDSSL